MDREAMILSLAGQVRYYANRLSQRIPRQVEHADLISAGWLGAINAVDRFDPARGSLRTFARRHIMGAMIDFLRGEDFLSRDTRREFKAACAAAELAGTEPPPAPRVVSIDAPKFREGDDKMGLDRLSMLASGERWAERLVDSIDLAAIVARSDVSPREIELLGRYFFRDEGLLAASRALGVTQSRGSQLKKRALEKLREAA